MGRTEFIMLLAVIFVGAGAFALESLSAETVRIIAITACCTLIALMVVGMFMRARVKKRRHQTEMRRLQAASQPGGES